MNTHFKTVLVSLVLGIACLRGAEDAYVQNVKVQTLMKSTADVAGRAIQYPAGGVAEMSQLLVEIPAGQSTGWHVHPNPCAAYILEGEITVEDEKGGKRHFVAGDAFAEVVNLKHCGVNDGKGPVKILLFVVGEKGVPVSRK